MRRVIAAALLLATASCMEVTASETAETTVGLSSKSGNAKCVQASPDPASVRVNQGVGFLNKSTTTLTIVLAEDDTPLVTVESKQTSGAVKFSSPGTRRYYIQGCGSSTAELHTIIVSVN
jgi:plastocyanin